MTNNVIMKESWALLAQDKSSAEVITLDFKPSTVYREQGQATAPSLEEEPTQTLDYTALPGEKVEDWPGKFIVEQIARAEAEAQAARHGAEATRLKEENQLLRQRVESLPIHLAQEVWKLVEPLKAELEELRSVHSSGSPSKRRSVKVLRERGIVVGPRPPFDDSRASTQSRSFKLPS